MSIGMNVYHKFKDLEALCAKLGFKIAHDPRGWGTDPGFHDLICLAPDDNEGLPAFSRDAILYRDDLDGCLTFLHGWQESLRYLEIVGATTKDKIRKAEQKHVEMLEAERTLYAIRNNRDPGDLRKRKNKAKLETDEVLF
jgi:hypothetical protein